MEVDIAHDVGTQWTDVPRSLTDQEASILRASGRLGAIKLHRQWTCSTLPAAIKAVDDLRSLWGGSGDIERPRSPIPIG